jgi:hypothetical protein
MYNANQLSGSINDEKFLAYLRDYQPLKNSASWSWLCNLIEEE